MEKIEFPCPHCGKRFKAPVEYAGRQGKCTSCGNVVAIPRESTPRTSDASSGDTLRSHGRHPCSEQGSERELCRLRPSWKKLYEAVAKAIIVSLFTAIVMGFLFGVLDQSVVGAVLLTIVVCLPTFGGFAVLWVWLYRIANVLTITPTRCVMRKGIFSCSTSEVRHTDVRNILVRQSFIDRFLNIGTLGVSTAAQSDVEINIEALDAPYEVRDLIDSYHN